MSEPAAVVAPEWPVNVFSYWQRLEAAWLIAARRYVEARYEDVDWYDNNACYCRCPGEDEHTNRNGYNHCRVYVDAVPVPTISCQHESCGAIIAAHNQVLRTLWRNAMEGRGLDLGPEQMAALNKELRAREGVVAEERARRNQERSELANLRWWARQNRQQILDRRPWPAAQILADSPTIIPADPTEHWRLILGRYEPGDTLWIADKVNQSGEWKSGREFSDRFQRVDYWLYGSRVPGVYICPAVLYDRSENRSNANVVRRPFIVVESDVLSRDEIGAVFQWLMAEHLRLRFVVDTGRRSLHGWLEAPDANHLKCLKAVLPELGIDSKVLTMSQPVRLPGAINPRTNKPQRLIYCDLLP